MLQTRLFIGTLNIINPYIISKFYGTPNNLSVLVHQLYKIIVK